jgi:DNA replication protein DnaC
MDMVACRFINQKQNIIFMGKPRFGKTHLAHSIGLVALKQGHSVMFVHANSLIEQLHRSKAHGKYTSVLHKINNVDLLIHRGWV